MQGWGRGLRQTALPDKGIQATFSSCFPGSLTENSCGHCGLTPVSTALSFGLLAPPLSLNRSGKEGSTQGCALEEHSTFFVLPREGLGRIQRACGISSYCLKRNAHIRSLSNSYLLLRVFPGRSMWAFTQLFRVFSTEHLHFPG